MPTSSTAPAQAVYTSRIIKATALLPETRTLLLNWDSDQDVDANLQRLKQENVFAKASRVRIADMLAIFRQRYLNDSDVRSALVTLAQGGMPNEVLDRILYYLSLRNDALLHDAVTELLLPTYQRGYTDVNVQLVISLLREQIADRRTESEWSEDTTLHVAQHILATLRDFGVLQGANRKQINIPFLPVTAFAFIAMLRHRELRSGDRLVDDPDWRVFFLPRLGVERLFLEAHQEHLLEYYAAGRIIRITFPVEHLEDYARFIVARAHQVSA